MREDDEDVECSKERWLWVDEDGNERNLDELKVCTTFNRIEPKKEAVNEEIRNIYKKYNKLGFFVTMSLNSPVKLECYGFDEKDSYGIMNAMLSHFYNTLDEEEEDEEEEDDE